MTNEHLETTGNYHADLSDDVAQELIDHKVIEETGLEPIPNREFDIPEVTLARLDHPQIERVQDHVTKLIDWLHTQAIKDDFGTTSEGAQARIDWARQNHQLNGDAANEAWERLGRENKFRTNSQIMAVIYMKNIAYTFLRDTPEAEELQKVYRSIIDSTRLDAGWYENANYDKRLAYIQRLEDQVTLFLKTLHRLYG